MRGRHSYPSALTARRRRTAVLGVVALVLASIVTVPAAMASHQPYRSTTLFITPTTHFDDNVNDCSNLGAGYIGYSDLHPNVSGEGSPQTSLGVTVNFTLTTSVVGNQPDTLAWSSSVPIDVVLVKGGPNTNQYTYPGGNDGPDTGLVAPDNTGGNWPAISNFSFCWQERPSTALSLDTTASDPLVAKAGDEVDLVFLEANDGNVTLLNPSLTTGPNSSGCSGTMAQILDGGFNAGDTDDDGAFEPGESWQFDCTVTVADGNNIAFDVFGHGTYNGNDVTWCADTNAPPANTTCDQQEKVSIAIEVINPSTDLDIVSNPAATAGSVTINRGGSITFTFTETNDAADSDLTKPSATDFLVLNSPSTGCTLAQTLGSADDGATAWDETLFNVGDIDGDGKLDRGEAWVWTCTISNIQSDLTVTATGHGIDETGDDVTWCADITAPPADTSCDQDERASLSVLVLGDQGCTPGYWKQSQHFDSWTAPYDPTDLVSTVFTSTNNPYAGTTLVGALGLKGGSSLAGAKQILLRAAVAAVLNEASSGVDYPWADVASIVTAVNAQLSLNSASDRASILALAAVLDFDNNQGCPLN